MAPRSPSRSATATYSVKIPVQVSRLVDAMVLFVSPHQVSGVKNLAVEAKGRDFRYLGSLP